MRVAQTVFIVRSQAEADLIKDVGRGGLGARRLIVQVAGAADALNPESLRRLRRAANPDTRRTPVVVWANTQEEATRWRIAGALAIVGPVTKANAAKAFDRAHLAPWIESAVYVGPDRRLKKSWFNRGTRRLADSAVGGQTGRAPKDESSFDTRLRQLRFASFGIGQADKTRRAQFAADAGAAVTAAEAARRMHAAAVMESLVRYLSARGAAGPLDANLIESHLQAAEAAPAEAAALVARLRRAVDRALGIG